MERFDAVIVGARCAGSTAAVALARGGWDVLLIDRDEFPSDTISTHGLWPNTIARLDELGALEPMLARHELPFSGHRIRVVDHEFSGEWTPIGGHTKTTGPRRRVLDLALLDAARAAGAEVRVGETVTGLIGAGTEHDPVRGVETEGGGAIEARWALAADGRASGIAKWLGLEGSGEMRGEMGMIYGYWTGLPETPVVHLDAQRHGALAWAPAEDGLHLVIWNCPPEATRGDAATRERAYQEAIRTYPATIEPAAFDEAELVTELQPVPETMLRGFFRRAAGPGWALIGDAGHFKHPSTAQGISDAIETALHVSERLLDDEDLSGFEAWRDERAAEHYDWSFGFAHFPRQAGETIFAGLERDPVAAQQFRDVFTRRVKPRSELFTPERLARWFGEAENA